jgi:hypothetical protein
MKSKSGSHDDQLCCISVYLALPTCDMTIQSQILKNQQREITFVRSVRYSTHHDHHSLSWHTNIRGPWVQYPVWMNKIPSLQWQCITRICRHQVRLGSELHLTWFMYSIYTCRVLHSNQVPNFLPPYCCSMFRCYWHRSALSVIYIRVTDLILPFQFNKFHTMTAVIMMVTRGLYWQIWHSCGRASW